MGNYISKFCSTVDSVEEKIAKYEEKLEKFINEKKELIVSVRDDVKEIKLLINTLREQIKNLD